MTDAAHEHGNGNGNGRVKIGWHTLFTWAIAALIAYGVVQTRIAVLENEQNHNDRAVQAIQSDVRDIRGKIDRLLVAVTRLTTRTTRQDNEADLEN